MSAEHYFNPYGYPAPGAYHPGQDGRVEGGHSQYPAGQVPGPGQAPWHSWATPYPGYAYPGAGGYAYPVQQRGSFLNFSNDRFVKGLLIGAAATYILTNETVQRTAIKGAVRAWSLMQGGVEELKERFQDAEAEMRAAEAGKEP